MMKNVPTQYRHPSAGRFSDSVFSQSYIQSMVQSHMDLPAEAWVEWIMFEMGFGL